MVMGKKKLDCDQLIFDIWCILGWEKLLLRAVLCAYSQKKYPKIWQVNRLNVVIEMMEGWLN